MVSAPAWPPRTAVKYSHAAVPRAASGSAPKPRYRPTVSKGERLVVNDPSKLPLPVLKKRSEFLAVAKGGKIFRRAFVLQALVRGATPTSPTETAPASLAPRARVGYTATRKVGNAVERNRIKRRLRAAMHAAQDCARLGTDYVLVGRQGALSQSFADLVADLAECLRSTASEGAARRREPGRRRKPGKHPGGNTHSAH